MSSADTRTRAMAAVMHNGLCTLRGSGCVNGAASAVDALLAAGWRPPADDAAIERAARAMYHADRERRGIDPDWGIDPDYTKMARAALAAAEEDGDA